MQRNRLVNTLDRDRVRAAVSGTPPSPASSSHPPHIERLLHRLDSSRGVRPVFVPPDLVTMNSIVRVIDLDTGDSDLYALRYQAPAPPSPLSPISDPTQATPITVHDPLGSELLGRWVDEVIEYEGRRGPIRLRVAALDYQPERSGDLAL